MIAWKPAPASSSVASDAPRAFGRGALALSEPGLRRFYSSVPKYAHNFFAAVA
jgi:hypothetical protein